MLMSSLYSHSIQRRYMYIVHVYLFNLISNKTEKSTFLSWYKHVRLPDPTTRQRLLSGIVEESKMQGLDRDTPSWSPVYSSNAKTSENIKNNKYKITVDHFVVK